MIPDDHRLAAALATEAGVLLDELRRRLHEDGAPPAVLKDEGDRQAHELLMRRLAETRPADAVLSEEEAPAADCFAPDRLWIIDPLDGTREFVAGKAEFCVLVGLCVDGRPHVGCVYDPIAELWHTGVVGEGAWRRQGDDGPWTPVRAGERTTLEGAHEVHSFYRDPPERQAWATAHGVATRTPCGSLGLKAVRVAEGAEHHRHQRPLRPDPPQIELHKPCFSGNWTTMYQSKPSFRFLRLPSFLLATKAASESDPDSPSESKSEMKHLSLSDCRVVSKRTAACAGAAPRSPR